MMLAFEVPPLAAVLLVLVAGLGWILLTWLYNVSFHPLAHIPGPKLAGATYLYQSYFSLVGGSRYYIQIKKLHDTYGPIIRITPNEVHLSDAENFERINFVGSKYPKSTFYDCFGIGYSTFSSRDIETHRIRRSALNPFFSRKMVLALEEIVQSKAKKLIVLASKKFSDGQSIDLHHAFRAISVDVITEYAFAQCYDLLDKPDIGKHFFVMIQGVGPTMWIFQQWPSLQAIALSMPASITKALSQPIGQVLELSEHCRKQCQAVKEAMDSGQASGSQPSIFQALLSPNEKIDGYVIPSVDQLKDEAYSILAAAADTTGNAMTVAAYHVVNDPAIYKRLTEELKYAFPNDDMKLDFVSLERLPYLTAVIKEGLRLSFGVCGRTPREVPEPGAIFNSYFLPAGSNVSMSSWVLHQDPEYFPNPQKFDPSRWLDLTEARRIDKAFIPFGKGSRGCVGMPLAYCEIYVTLGHLFRRYSYLKSNLLTPEDLVYDDHFSSYHPTIAVKFHVSNEEK